MIKSEKGQVQFSGVQSELMADLGLLLREMHKEEVFTKEELYKLLERAVFISDEQLRKNMLDTMNKCDFDSLLKEIDELQKILDVIKRAGKNESDD